MKTIKFVSIIAALSVLIGCFSGCGKNNVPVESVVKQDNYLVTDTGEKRPFYTDGLFNYNIITPVNDNDCYELTKATIFRKARTLNNKRPEFIRDNATSKKCASSIYVGDTVASISKEAKDILNGNKNNHFNYLIYAKGGDIAIVAPNIEMLEEAINFFTKNFLKDTKCTISENYLYHYIPTFDSKLQINNTDVAYYVIQCENCPSGIVYRGCEELQNAILKVTERKIPIIRDKDYVADSMIKVVKRDGNSEKYGAGFENGSLVIYGESDSALNAALHNVAKNIDSIKNKTNIPDSYSFEKTYTLETPCSEGYKLVWSDEFNEDEINLHYWKLSDYQRLNNYRSPDAISVADGCAIITSKPTTLPDGTAGYQTGELEGKNVNFAYGYFEIRAKLPYGPGNWASFWASGQFDAKHKCYPEIDVFETTGSASGLASALHTWWLQGTTINGLYAPGVEESGHISHLTDKSYIKQHSGDYTEYRNVNNEYFGKDFHTFGCEWTPAYLRFFCDGAMYCEVDLKTALIDPNYGYKVTPFLSLTDKGTVNFRIGNLLNSPDAHRQSDDTSEIPSKYYIDYVRLYQMDNVGVLNVLK